MKPPVDDLVEWQLRTRSLRLPRSDELPLVMGIVNTTPDSFSDGGLWTRTETAVAHGLSLIEDGADILDIGGESTRPFSDPVDSQEEWRRVGEVVRILSHETDCPISIDTSKASVAKNAIDNGAEIINDVTGLQGDPAMVQIASETGAGICAMHMQGTPKNMQKDPNYEDVMVEVSQFFEERITKCEALGLSREQLILDVGIGFGKTLEHNLTLIKNMAHFRVFGCKVLVGASRKSMIDKIITSTAQERLPGTLVIHLKAVENGASIVRCHDVKEHVQALAVLEAMK